MDFNNYQRDAVTYFKDQDSLGFLYPALGLGGESGEVCEKVYALSRYSEHGVPPESVDDLVKELGDVLWYVAVFSHCLGYKLSDVAVMRLSEFASDLDIYHSGFNIILPSLCLSSYAGKAQEVVKKALRDNNGLLSDADKDDIATYLSGVLWYLTVLASGLGGVRLDEVARINLQKLQSRKDRGVLNGKGDNR